MIKETPAASSQAYGFGWWTFWSWLGLIGGTLFCLSMYATLGGLALVFAFMNIGLCIYMLKFSRTAFIITTIISLNPILWIAHWIYLKNRWGDPRLLENTAATGVPDAPTSSGKAHDRENANLMGLAPKSQNQSTSEVNLESDEALWEDAMNEVDSHLRRPGLWAKCFAQADGIEAAARARYMATRVTQVKAEREASLRSEQVAEARAAEESRLNGLSEAQRAYELLPKGTCPSCAKVIPLSTIVCPNCKAMFGPGAAWSIEPLEK